MEEYITKYLSDPKVRVAVQLGKISLGLAILIILIKWWGLGELLQLLLLVVAVPVAVAFSLGLISSGTAELIVNTIPELLEKLKEDDEETEGYEEVLK